MPLKSPDEELSKGLENLKCNHEIANDWELQFEACNIIRRICKYHSHLLSSCNSMIKTVVEDVLIKSSLKLLIL